MRHETDRLRALNVPQRVQVELDEQRRPRVVMREPGNVKRVESLGENWRMDDEWWRQPIVRRYVEVVLEGGGRVVLFVFFLTRRRSPRSTLFPYAEAEPIARN